MYICTLIFYVDSGSNQNGSCRIQRHDKFVWILFI